MAAAQCQAQKLSSLRLKQLCFAGIHGCRGQQDILVLEWRVMGDFSSSFGRHRLTLVTLGVAPDNFVLPRFSTGIRELFPLKFSLFAVSFALPV